MSAAALHAAAPGLALGMLTPGGRCDRRGFLLVAAVMLATQAAAALMIWLAGAEHDGPLGMTLNAAFLWLAVTATSKRLHDVGRSAWAILWAFFGVMLWTIALVVMMMLVGGDALVPGAPLYWVTIAGTMLPVFLATLWLHFKRGESGPNRFGEPPGASGFSLPRRSDRAGLPLAPEAAAHPAAA